MSTNSYFPPQQQPQILPQPSQEQIQQQYQFPLSQHHQTPPPPYAQYAQQSSSQQPWDQPTSNSQPATVPHAPAYNPATFGNQAQPSPVDYPQGRHPQQQPASQSWPMGNVQSNSDQASMNPPPTPAYTPSSHPGFSAAQQYSSAQVPQNAQQPYTAPPTPAYTSSPCPGSSAPQQYSNAQQTQNSQQSYTAPPTPAYTSSMYSNPSAPQQNQIIHDTHYNQQSFAAPATPYATPGQASLSSSVSGASFAPPLVQTPSNYSQPAPGEQPQTSYFEAPPVPPAYGPPHQPPTQGHQSGYPAEKQGYQQGQYPPTVNVAQHAASEPAPSGYPAPPHANPHLYRSQSSPQPPQYGMHPQGKQEYYQHYSPQVVPPQSQYPPMALAPDYCKPSIVEPIENINQAFLPPPSPIPPGSAPPPAKDDMQSGKVKRFLGDTLMVRVARSGVATASSTWKMPKALSPWGDNNPVTLPNVRYRDAVLFTTFAFVGAPIIDSASDAVGGVFGADHFVSEIVGSGAGFITGNTIVKYGVFQIVEQAIDKGIIEHILPEVEKTMHTTSAKSLQVAIKHKLMGVDADIRFAGTYPTANIQACEKGWFAPYLFASARTPVIPRAQDFAMAQFFAPYVTADAALAHKLLSENASTIPLCDPDPTHHLPHGRLIILFTGISPYRANMWSTSRRPGAGLLIFHLLNGCPALVLPVQATRTPVMAWSPWTLNQMKAGAAAGYQAQTHHKQVCEWVSPLVERSGLYPCVRDVATFDRVLGRVVSMIINGAVAVPQKGVDGKFLGKVDGERAGIVAFRY